MKKLLTKTYEDYHPQFVKDAKGRNAFAVISMDNFQSLIEDLEDLATIAERKNDERIPFEVFEKKMKQSGRL